jgi:hypothetical protein
MRLEHELAALEVDRATAKYQGDAKWLAEIEVRVARARLDAANDELKAVRDGAETAD